MNVSRGVCLPKKIADKLSIDRQTVYRHLANIRKALEVHSSIGILHFIVNEIEFDPYVIKLTPRGKEVFQLILEGLGDKQIGERLGISYSGVRRHKEKMLINNSCESMLELISKYYATRTEKSSNKQE